MPCYKPLTAWRSQQVNKSGKRSLQFRAEGAFGDRLPLPCGRCIGCRLEHSRQWAMRIMHEAQLHSESCFVTLTYAPEHLPFGGTLNKKHFQDFMKRLRRRFPLPREISYYHAGEYGSKTRRAHYHACIFGLEFSDQVLYKTVNGIPLYTSDILEDVWGLGQCTVGTLTFESAAYVARYVVDKLSFFGEHEYEHLDLETGELIPLQPEYATMSLKRPIGKAWYQQFRSDTFPSDEVIHRGRSMKPPKYYDKLYEIESPERFKALKEARRSAAGAHARDRTPARLEARRRVKMAQLQLLKREIPK